GDSYSVDVTYDDGSTATLSAAVTGVVALPTGLAPNTTGSTSPTFSWTAPTPAPSVYHYNVYIQPQICCSQLWGYEPLRSTATSLVYNLDGHASQSALTMGTSYNWALTVVDEQRNTSQGSATFQAQ